VSRIILKGQYHVIFQSNFFFIQIILFPIEHLERNSNYVEYLLVYSDYNVVNNPQCIPYQAQCIFFCYQELGLETGESVYKVLRACHS
jgi:hypothetical protein